MARKLFAKELTYGVFGSLIDLILWQIFLVGASVGKSGPRGVNQAFREADEILSKINHHTLTTSWHQLFKKKLLTYKKRQNLYNVEVTDFGKKKLEQFLPHYFTKRPWDNKIYLVTYDIPEEKHKKRDLLRKFLIRIGCKILQKSVWVTLYNPRQLLDGFISRHRIPGMIIISDIGKDGGIGETTIQDLLVRLYSLEKINDRYDEFIKNAREKNKPVKFLLLDYLSILKDDPQLPFELLPDSWLGDKAYHQYQQLQSGLILTRSRTRP